MDPRQTLSRGVSTNVSPASYTPNMSSAYAMSYHTQQPHLPPIQAHHQSYHQPHPNYLPQSYRPELPRYQSAPNPIAPPDRYNASQNMNPPTGMGSLPPSSLLPQPSHLYQQPQNYTPTTSAPQAYPQRIAPAPPRSDLNSFPTSFSQAENRPPLWTSSTGPPPSAPVQQPVDQSRTHVVGSQGRRGILPSAPGRPPVATNGATGSPKNAAIPPKDADGKFPCPNCNKTYLHAKHLKRHLLRHTGDRPYMCVLCRDTFSRSDILKRHFQKCSLRRGNPAGLSHLSSPAAHLKKSQAASAKSSTDSLSTASAPATSSMPNGAFANSAVSVGTSSANSSNFSEAPQMSYTMASAAPANLQRPATDQTFAPAGTNPISSGANGSWSLHNPKPNPMLFQTTTASSDHFGIAASAADDKRNVMAVSHQQPNEDWNHIFQGGGNENYMNPMFPAPLPNAYEHVHGVNVKKEDFDAHEGVSNGYYMPSAGLNVDGKHGSSR